MTYARGPVTVKLELIQGTHTEELATQGVPGNDWAFFDPRLQHASQIFRITPEVAARFQAGPAKLRATAIGRPQLSRLPPPLVREQEVELEGDRER